MRVLMFSPYTNHTKKGLEMFYRLNGVNVTTICLLAVVIWFQFIFFRPCKLFGVSRYAHPVVFTSSCCAGVRSNWCAPYSSVLLY